MSSFLRASAVALCALSFAAVPRAARADLPGSQPSVGGYVPRVPVSALAAPKWGFDPSRLQISTSVSVGSGSGFGGGTDALQVTSFRYRFDAPLWMSVNVGNSWSGGTTRGTNPAFFLEGLDLGYQPFANFRVQVHYQDVRSPLQYSNRGFWSP